jgi:hypothetical protein
MSPQIQSIPQSHLTSIELTSIGSYLNQLLFQTKAYFRIKADIKRKADIKPKHTSESKPTSIERPHQSKGRIKSKPTSNLTNHIRGNNPFIKFLRFYITEFYRHFLQCCSFLMCLLSNFRCLVVTDLCVQRCYEH